MSASKMREEPGGISSGYWSATWVQAMWRRRRGTVEVLAEHGEEALDAAGAGVLRVELLGAGEEDVAVGQVEGAGVAEMLVVGGQEAEGAGFEVELVGVSEGLLDEEDSLAVM